MDEKHFTTIVPLLYNASPVLRRAGISELTRRLGELRPDGVEYLLYHSVDDPDEATAAKAREGLVHVRNWRARNRQVQPSQQELLQGMELSELRFAAASSFGGVVEKLHDIALTATNADLANGAVTVLGKLAFEGSLEVLFKAAERKRTSLSAIRAISNFSAQEVFGLLKGFFAHLDLGDAGNDVLESLAKVGFSDVFDFLKMRAQDPNPAVRAAVARGLGQRDEKDAESLLLALLKDGAQEVVAGAIDGLALLGRQSSADELKRLIEPDQPIVLRVQALAALGHLQSRDALPWIYAQLGDQSPDIVAGAISALAHYSLPIIERVQHFKPLVSHKSPIVRSRAIVQLASADEGMALSALKKMFASTFRDVRKEAARATGELDNPEATKWLVTLINTESDEQVMDAALEALTQLEHKKSVDTLKRLLKHANAEVRAEALQTYSRLASNSAMAELEAMFTLEKEETVRARLVNAMGNLCGPDNYLAVTRVLQDRSPLVVVNAVEALDRLGILQAIPFLTPLLNHGNHTVQAAAAVALWKLGSLNVSEKLEQLLSSHEEGPEFSALSALRQMADFLQPVLIAERPLLLAALKEEYEKAKSKERINVGEVAAELERSLTGVPAFDYAFNASAAGYEAAMDTLQGRGTPVVGNDRAGGKSSQKVRAEGAALKGPAPIALPERESTQRREDYVPTSAQEAILGQILRERSLGNEEKLSPLLLKLLALEPAHPIGRYLALKYSSTDEAAAKVSGTGLRSAWDKSRFLPGLCVLVNRSQRKSNNKTFMKEYLSLLGVVHRIYGDLLHLAVEHLKDGDEQGTLKIIKFLVQRMPMNTDLHAKIGDLSLELGELDMSLEHALSAFAANQRDFRSAILACSISLRQEKLALADCLCEIILGSPKVEKRYVSKAQRLKGVIDAKKAGAA